MLAAHEREPRYAAGLIEDRPSNAGTEHPNNDRYAAADGAFGGPCVDPDAAAFHTSGPQHLTPSGPQPEPRGLMRPVLKG